MRLVDYLLEEGKVNPIRAAIAIALTETKTDEEEMIAYYRMKGCYSVATMITGNDAKALREVTRNVFGACLNERIIDRKKEHVHPLGHAIQEAISGTRLDSSVGQNCRFKVAIARVGNEISVAMYGDLGFHELSSHKVMGSGYQILGVDEKN